MAHPANIRCPACGKTNRAAPQPPVAADSFPCTRCQADLIPLQRIQHSSEALKKRMLQQLASGQRAEARASFARWHTLCPVEPSTAALVRSLLASDLAK